MRRRKGSSSSGRHGDGHGDLLAWVLLLAALMWFVLAGAPGCMARQMVYSARGTMLFLPAGSSF